MEEARSCLGKDKKHRRMTGSQRTTVKGGAGSADALCTEAAVHSAGLPRTRCQRKMRKAQITELRTSARVVSTARIWSKMATAEGSNPFQGQLHLRRMRKDGNGCRSHPAEIERRDRRSRQSSISAMSATAKKRLLKTDDDVRRKTQFLTAGGRCRGG
jgi:hypothetical protein